jgi:hypothetical protein
MPNYNAQNPPCSIFPGDVALAFNNESPVTGQASQQFALPSYAGFPENGRTIRWQVSYATAPSAVTIHLQTAMNDEDAQYAIPTGATNMTTSLTSCDILSRQACGEFRARQNDVHHWRLRRDRADSRLTLPESSLQIPGSIALPSQDFPVILSDDTVCATVYARCRARDDPGAGLATSRTKVFAGILICAPLLIVGGIMAYFGKVSPVSSNTSSAARLLAASNCEAAENAIVAAGAIPAVDNCLDAAGQNSAPGQPSGSATHSITVKFDYDFTRNRVCTPEMKKKEADACVATFVVYDISNPKAYKLFSIPAPPGSKGMVKGITATSPRMLFGVGKHRIGVAAVSGNGRESPPVDCNVIVDIPPDATTPAGGSPPAK